MCIRYLARQIFRAVRTFNVRRTRTIYSAKRKFGLSSVWYEGTATLIISDQDSVVTRRRPLVVGDSSCDRSTRTRTSSEFRRRSARICSILSRMFVENSLFLADARSRVRRNSERASSNICEKMSHMARGIRQVATVPADEPELFRTKRQQNQETGLTLRDWLDEARRGDTWHSRTSHIPYAVRQMVIQHGILDGNGRNRTPISATVTATLKALRPSDCEHVTDCVWHTPTTWRDTIDSSRAKVVRTWQLPRTSSECATNIEQLCPPQLTLRSRGVRNVV